VSSPPATRKNFRYLDNQGVKLLKRSGRRNGVAVLRGVSLLVYSAMLLFAAEGVTLAQSVQTRHLRDEVKNGEAKFVNRLPATQSLRLNIALPLRNEAGLEKFYDPKSSLFHQFLSVQEFPARFGPIEQDYDAVLRFAEENGLRVTGTSENPDEIKSGQRTILTSA
jgi:subtilase family serine protease